MFKIAPYRAGIGCETPGDNDWPFLQRRGQVLPAASLCTISWFPEEKIDARLHRLAEASLRQLVATREPQRRHHQPGPPQWPAVRRTRRNGRGADTSLPPLYLSRLRSAPGNTPREGGE